MEAKDSNILYNYLSEIYEDNYKEQSLRDKIGSLEKAVVSLLKENKELKDTLNKSNKDLNETKIHFKNEMESLKELNEEFKRITNDFYLIQQNSFEENNKIITRVSEILIEMKKKKSKNIFLKIFDWS